MSILTTEKMQSIKPCSKNNITRLAQIIAETEFLDLQNLVGTDIYNSLVEDCSQTPIDPELKSILDNGLYAVIAYFAYANYIQEISVVDTFTGMVVKQREDAQPVSQGAIKNLVVHNREIAKQYYEKIREDLLEYYNKCDKETITPGYSEIYSVRRTRKNRGINIINL